MIEMTTMIKKGMCGFRTCGSTFLAIGSNMQAGNLMSTRNQIGHDREFDSGANVQHSAVFSYSVPLIVCVVLTFSGLVFSSAGAIAQQAKIIETIGAWNLVCGRPIGAKFEKCAAEQNVIAENKPGIGLQVVFVISADKKRRLFRIVAPSGILLPQGIGLLIDDVQVGHAGYLRCGRPGCYSEVTISDDVFKKLKNGNTAYFIIWATVEEGTAVPVSLKGFAEISKKLE